MQKVATLVPLAAVVEGILNVGDLVVVGRNVERRA